MAKIQAIIAKYPKISIYILLWLLTTLLLYTLLGDIFVQLNDYMFAAGGDGLKVHYCMDYYVKYGNKLYFEGYQYPQGVHVMNVEAPLLFISLRWFCRNIIDISDYNVALINIMMLSSYYLCVFVMYPILRRHHLSVFFAVLFSLIITFFSPQVNRLTGHYFLALPCFFPLIWYVTIRIYEKKNILTWSIILFLIVFIFSNLHLYYFLIGGAFLMAYMGLHFLQNIRLFKQNLLTYTATLFALFIPLIFIQLWLKLTTIGTQDGVQYPFGFLYYIADIRTVFLPYYSPEKDFWNFFEFLSPRKWFNHPYSNPVNWEGLAFVGFVGFAFLFFFLYRMAKYVWKKQFKAIFRPILPAPSQIAIWASVFVLLFAMGYPLNFIEDAEDKVGLLRQFRSLGRLAWVFYYVYMTVCAYYIYAIFRYINIFSSGKLRHIGYTFVFFCIAISSLELFIPWKNAVNYIKTCNISNGLPFWKKDMKQLLAENGYKNTDFQAIISFPFYQIGSEKFALEGTWHSHIYSYTTSRSTGLPMINNFSARTPLSVSSANIQLISHPFIKKELISQLPDKRPFLLLYSHENEQMTDGEKRLIALSKTICKLNEITFARLDIAAFADEQAQMIALYKTRKNNNTLIIKDKMQLSAATDAIKTFTFGDEMWAKDTNYQQGFWVKKGNATFVETALIAKDSSEIECSFWIKIDGNSNYLPQITLVEYQGEKEVLRKDWDRKLNLHIYKNWVRGEINFPLLASGNKIKLEVLNAKNFYLDNILIRPKYIDVYNKVLSDSVFVLNNYPIGF